MIVTSKKIDKRISFYITLEDSDTAGPATNPAGARRKHLLCKKNFFLEIPSSLDFIEPHPDQKALALILLLNPFIGKRLKLEDPVTKDFANLYNKLTGKTIEHVSEELSRVSFADSERKPAIAFSGGIDSTAAVLIAPEESILVFSDRKILPGQLYNKRAAIQSCEEWEKRGKEVYRVFNDIENIIDPPTFTHPLATAFPAIYLAETLKVDSIGFGSLVAHVYGLLNNKFNSKNKKPYREYDELLKIAGLPQLHSTSGINSTIGVLLKEDLLHIAQSCMYGVDLGEPCGVCQKCLMKELRIGIYTNNDYLIDSRLEKVLYSKIDENLRRIPMNAQYNYMTLSSNLKEKDKAMHLLSKKTGSYRFFPDISGYWYEPSAKLMPEKYRAIMINNTLKYFNKLPHPKKMLFENINLAYHRYSPVRRYWHWQFWKYYGAKYDKHIIGFNAQNLVLSKGEEFTNLKIFKRNSLWRKRVINQDVKWGSSDGSIAYYKNGKVIAKKKGEARLYARYGNSKAQLSVKVR